MKFSSGFTAFVAASVATAHLSSAAPVTSRDVSQSNSQGTTQQASGKIVAQDSANIQKNKQGVQISADAAWKLSHPAIVVPAPSSSAPSTGSSSASSTGDVVGVNAANGNNANAQVLGTGNQSAKRSIPVEIVDADLLNSNNANAQVIGTGKQTTKRSWTGELIDADAANSNNANVQILGTGTQTTKRGLIGIDALNGDNANLQILGTGPQKIWDGSSYKCCTKDASGNLIELDLLNCDNANVQVLGTGKQTIDKRQLGQLFEGASGKQSASADGFGGMSSQGQSNAPVLSGAGNSLTAGGAQSSENNGQGGQITQKLLQSLQARQFLGESGKQGASANGYGGFSSQGQSNAPVVSGAGNSVTAGGAQQAQNDGTGGQITQGLKQIESLGGSGSSGASGLSSLFGKRQLFESGKQGASANGYGGSSMEGQTNTPVLSGAGNSLTAGGAQSAEDNGTGGSIQQTLSQLESLGGGMNKRQLFESGKQGASANGYGGTSMQGQTNTPVLSGAGNSLTAGGAQSAEDNGTGGSIQQTLSQLESLGGGMSKRQLFASGKQGASADGFGGSSMQGETNTPVLSGAGSSLTAGGAQGATNDGQGGNIQQSIFQKLGLGKRQLFASGKQQGSADGFGGSSFQGQTNRPVVSGADNSVTTGGEQLGENNGMGGSVDQSILQKLFQKRQFEALGSQGASANGQGGDSFQYQSNRPVVSGYGNSVTAGGAQGATNDGTGGSISQQLEQLFQKRQFQGLGQGINQGIDQTGNAGATGGSAYIYGNNGPAYVDGTATGGTVEQGASGKQDGAQSATQGLTQETLNRFFERRQLQNLDQGIGQGIHQNGQAAAQGGSAYIVGGNGPAYVQDGATGGSVQQNGQASQQGQQSGTQQLSQEFENLFERRDISNQGQGVSQSTVEKGSANSQGGNVYVAGWSNGPVDVDASSHAGVVNQDSTSNQASKQAATQASTKENVNYNSFWARNAPVFNTNTAVSNKDNTQIQGNSQNTDVSASASANASPKTVESGYFFHHYPAPSFDSSSNAAVAGDITQNVEANQANKQAASQNNSRRSVPSQINTAYGAQYGNANSHGGNTAEFESNDKVVNGNGVQSTQGGAQTADGSSTAGTISQLLQL